MAKELQGTVIHKQVKYNENIFPHVQSVKAAFHFHKKSYDSFTEKCNRIQAEKSQ